MDFDRLQGCYALLRISSLFWFDGRAQSPFDQPRFIRALAVKLNPAKTNIFLTIIVKLSKYLCINKNKGIMSKSEKIAASLRIADNMMHRASTNSDFEKLSEMMSDEMLKLIEEMGLVLA